MFTYNLTDTVVENGQVRVTFEITNGTITVSRTWYVTDEDDINRRLKNEIALLDKAVALASRLVKNNYTIVEKEPDPVVPLTAVQVAEAKLYELKRLIELGVMKETDQEFVDAVSAYKTAVTATPK